MRVDDAMMHLLGLNSASSYRQESALEPGPSRRRRKRRSRSSRGSLRTSTREHLFAETGVSHPRSHELPDSAFFAVADRLALLTEQPLVLLRRSHRERVAR